jgi:hypothetical protein
MILKFFMIKAIYLGITKSLFFINAALYFGLPMTAIAKRKRIIFKGAHMRGQVVRVPDLS